MKLIQTLLLEQGVADDSSGILKHVKILNSATEVEPDKETNGLSMVGVGSGTVVEDITVDYSVMMVLRSGVVQLT